MLWVKVSLAQSCVGESDTYPKCLSFSVTKHSQTDLDTLLLTFTSKDSLFPILSCLTPLFKCGQLFFCGNYPFFIISGHDKFVAFSATASSSRNYSSGDIVQFPTVLTNEFSDGIPGYDPDTGIFTVRLPGYYFFGLTLYKSNVLSNSFSVYLKQDLEPILRVRNTNDVDSITHGSQVIVHLDEGVTVYVETTTGGELYGSTSSAHSIFSGMLLHEDNPIETS